MSSPLDIVAAGKKLGILAVVAVPAGRMAGLGRWVAVIEKQNLLPGAESMEKESDVRG